MSKPERLFHLSDEQWSQIEGASPQRRGQSGFERVIPNRTAFEAVLFRLRTGCPWRDLPRAYGDDHPIYMRWQRWVKSGVPQRAMVAWWLGAAKRGEVDLSLAPVDSTIGRAHQHAAGARKKRRASPGAQPGRLEHEDPRGGYQREPGAGRHPHRRPGG